eukprot:2251588-Amphidinium_carterae.1
MYAAGMERRCTTVSKGLDGTNLPANLYVPSSQTAIYTHNLQGSVSTLDSSERAAYIGSVETAAGEHSKPRERHEELCRNSKDATMVTD